MDKLFNVGDLVRLKSGGPEMTVKENKEIYLAFKEFRGEFFCTCFDGTQSLTQLFAQDTLKKI